MQATFLGNAAGGVLTVTDEAKTARIAFSGNYLRFAAVPYNALCITAAVPFRKKSGWLA